MFSLTLNLRTRYTTWKPLLSLSLTTALLSSTGSLTAQEWEPVFIPNGDFENQASAGMIPEWEETSKTAPSPWAGGGFIGTNTGKPYDINDPFTSPINIPPEGHGGNYALRSYASFIWLSDRFEDGYEYRLTFKARTYDHNNPDSSGGGEIVFGLIAGGPDDPDWTSLNGSERGGFTVIGNAWQTHTQTFTREEVNRVSAVGKTIRPGIYGRYIGTLELWIDDVVLEKRFLGSLLPLKAIDDAVTTPVGESILIDVVANDEGPVFEGSMHPETQPPDGEGEAVLAAVAGVGWRIRYTPPANFEGTTSFTYEVCDEGGSVCDFGTVTVTVGSAGNTPPSAIGDTFYLDAGSTYELDVLANDTDMENDSLSILSTTASSIGATIAIKTSQTESDKLEYTAPGNGFKGEDIFTYTVSDGTDESNSSVRIAIGQDSRESWTQRHFSAEDQDDLNISGLTADPDKDGINNLWELILGSDPKSPDLANDPVETVVELQAMGESLLISHCINLPSILPQGSIIKIQMTTDLAQGWTTIAQKQPLFAWGLEPGVTLMEGPIISGRRLTCFEFSPPGEGIVRVFVRVVAELSS